MNKSFLYLLFLILLPVSGFAQSKVVKISAVPASSTVTYQMSHPLHEFSGVDKKVNAVINFAPQSNEISSAVVVLSVADFNSGNQSRDAQAKETLDADKYPFVTFSSASIKDEKNTLLITGTLTFHNVSRKITFNASKRIEAASLIVDGGFNVDMTKYKIKQPSLLGMKTDKLIKLQFHLNFNLPEKDFTLR